MSSDRVDLFSLIHKGVRRVLFETAMELSRTDFAAPDEREHAEAAIRRCFGYLREHADHEDREIQPWITRFAPAVAAVLAADTDPGEGVHRGREPAARGGGSAGRGLALARSCNAAFYLLVSDQLRHLNRGERRPRGDVVVPPDPAC